MAALWTRITDIPSRVLINNVLPFCELEDVLSLGGTNRLFALITADEKFWRQKLADDYNFTGSGTAKTSSWKSIYQRLRIFLSVSDFPVMRVRVLCPNYQGKEVLSFVIIVDLGSGKEPWRIEKLYSDFISLDQKIRSANRNLTKEMPSLPDNKLWQDSTPTKVDQRKASQSIHKKLDSTDAGCS